MDLRTLAFFLSLSLASLLSLSAQERTETGYTTAWEQVLTEQRDMLTVSSHPLQGLSFVAYECVTSDALDYWKDHMEELGGKAKGKNPTRVTGATVPALGTSIPLIAASAIKDREEGGVRITVVFALNDSTAAPEVPGIAGAVHEMSVAVNRAVVRAQVAEQEKLLNKSNGHLADSESDRMKADKRATHASSDLKKIQDRQAKLLRKQTALQQDAEKLQKQYDGPADARTLEKMGKTHQKLADVEKAMALGQQRAVVAMAQADSKKDQIPGARADEQSNEPKKDHASGELEALKSKLAAIR